MLQYEAEQRDYVTGCSLEEAQIAKLDALIEQAGLTADHEVLEIGFGWGSLAMRAVQAGYIFILR